MLKFQSKGFICRESRGFLSGFIFDDKSLNIRPSFTQNDNDALIMFSRYEYTLKYDLADFDFHKCEIINRECDNDDILKSSMILLNRCSTFKNDCELLRKLNNVNNVRKDVMKIQKPLVEFFKTAKFKTDGSLFKNDNDEYLKIRDNVKSNMWFEHVADNLWLTVKRGNVSHTIYIILNGEREQEFVNLKPLTVNGYKKALDKITKNKDLMRKLKAEISSLTHDFYISNI